MSEFPKISGLTREVLERFLPNHEAIKAFEAIIELLRNLIPQQLDELFALVQDALLGEQLAEARGTQALATLTSIEQSLKLLALASAPVTINEAPITISSEQSLQGEVAQLREELGALTAAVGEFSFSSSTSIVIAASAIIYGAGVPVDGVAGTGVGSPKVWLYIDETGSDIYINAGTTLSPLWKLIGRSA